MLDDSADPPGMECSTSQSPPRVLLVDDETHVLRLLSLKLGGAGFEVGTAVDGASALDAMQQWQPSLVVSDCNMPGLDGVALLRAMADDVRLQRIPVVMLTGRGHTLPDEVRAMPMLVAVERKPFSGRQLLGLVEQLLGPPGERAMAA